MSRRVGIGRIGLEIPPTEELIKVGLIALGAGAKGAVADLVKKVAKDVDTDTAGMIAGGLMYLFGGQLHPYVKWAGIGVLAGSLAPKIEELIPQGGGGGGGGESEGGGFTGGDTLKALAQSEASRPMR